MREYLVTWTINVEADDDLDAAKQAWGTLQDPGNLATCLHVQGEGSDADFDMEDIDDIYRFKETT